MGRKVHDDSLPEDAGHSIWITACDLMCNLIFIFLVIIGAVSMRFKRDESAFVAAKAELQSPALTRQKILYDMQAMLRRAGLDVEVLPEEGILRLSEQVLSFQPAKAVPDPDKLLHLGLVARTMSQVIPCFTKRRRHIGLSEEVPTWCEGLIAGEQAYQCPEQAYSASIETVMIEGHTDATAVRAGAGYRDNLALSAARATTVLRLLRLCGTELSELYNRNKQVILAASGYSDERPIVASDTRDPRNRRIDIRLVMDLPGNALEGTRASQTSRGPSL